MKKYRKIILDAVLFAAIVGITIWGLFGGEDLSEMGEAIRQCNIWWLIPAVICVMAFIAGESIVIWHMLDCYGIWVKKRLCFLFSSVGFFFSCITPSASGGQPMQIYFMRKEDIPVPIGTVILLVVTITYKLVLVVIGLGLTIFGQSFLQEYVAEAIWIFYLGVLLNVGCVIFMSVVVLHPYFAKRSLVLGLWLLERLHILKHKAERMEKLERSMKMYHEAAEFMRTHWAMIGRVFLITIAQRIAMFAVTYFVYLSFGLSEMGFIPVMFLQSVISISVDMLPLPGGMGISEGLFMIIFRKVFGEALLLPALVLSRGLGYYSELIFSALFTLLAFVVFEIRDRRGDKKRRSIQGGSAGE